MLDNARHTHRKHQPKIMPIPNKYIHIYIYIYIYFYNAHEFPQFQILTDTLIEININIYRHELQFKPTAAASPTQP